MPRLTLLLTVAYYGNFLKLWVGERREQCKQKTDNYWTANRRREVRRVVANAREKSTIDNRVANISARNNKQSERSRLIPRDN